jgi:hypothetical protein
MSDTRNLHGAPDGAMSLDRLREILEAYGAGAERWPAADRGAMLALLNHSSEARALRDRAYALDRVLDRMDAPPPSESLFDAVAAMRPAAPRSTKRARIAPLGRFLLPSALAASIAVGVFIGFGVGNYVVEPAAERQTVQTAPAAETAAAPVAIASSTRRPSAPASTGLGSAALLAGSDAPVEETEGSVPLI